MKRLLDVVVSLTALLVLLPLFVIAAIAIKLDSSGPVMFLQERVGRGMRRFRVMKFRTMIHAPAQSGAPLVTVAGDQRITRVGAFLRKSKLDEFPQLINVLKGDMSLVGPRPEVPRYVEMFAADYEVILAVRPGLTDPASFKYRDEGTLLKRAADPEKEYTERILPDKIRLAKAYVADQSLSLDLVLILKTLLEAVGMEATPVAQTILRHRRPVVVAIHLLLIVFAYYAAWALRFDGEIPAPEWQLFWKFLPWLLLIRSLAFVPFRLYEGLWRYTSTWDAANIAMGVGTSTIVFAAIVRFGFGEVAHPRSVFIMDALLLAASMSAVRLLRRAYHELVAGRAGNRVLVFGAGDSGEMIVRELKKSQEYRVVGLVDDDKRKLGRRIHGVPVLGSRYDLRQIIAQRRPSEILIAIDASDGALLRELVHLVEPFKVKLTTLPRLTGHRHRQVALNDVRSLALDDLLSREPVGLDQAPVRQLIAGRRVLVTGAGGSIGSELCRQIAGFGAASLVMFERHEGSLHTIQLHLGDHYPTLDVHAIVGDITDSARVAQVMRVYRPEIVFHAAAHKHVPLMEWNICEAVKNNVRGTRIVAEAADQFGADRFILISTDKAVNPTSVMGLSKRLAEMIVRTQARGSGTSFSIVRFGNVLGSSGSVVPRFMDQIRRGGPVTITHPDVCRYFMLIPEAVQLVLHAAAQAENGATYVLEMGDPVKLVDMARDLIRLTGFVPDEEIKIAFIGLRPGEKLFEELVGADETSTPSAVDKVLCVRSLETPSTDFAAQIESLEDAARNEQVSVVQHALMALAGGTVTPEPVRSVLQQAAGEEAVSIPPETHPEQVCPHCQGEVHRSRAKNVVERIRKEFTELRLFRCPSCGWRGWLPLLDFGHEMTGNVSAPPDLSALDGLPGQKPAGRDVFSPRNLT